MKNNENRLRVIIIYTIWSCRPDSFELKFVIKNDWLCRASSTVYRVNWKSVGIEKNKRDETKDVITCKKHTIC